jgi:anaerobic selenocysteine-containing dehydrogenase
MSEVRHSVCALDCPDCCAVLVNVDAAGKGDKLRGDPGHPVTRGFLCGKVAQYLEREYHPDRLLHPLKRVGAKGEGRFERVSWDAALDEISARLLRVASEHGPESILPYSYGGSMGYIHGNGMDRRFFHRLGASRLDRTICSSAGGAGLMEALGVRYGTEPEQFAHSKLIIAWGSNIHGNNVHLWPFIVEAKRNGAKLVVIDPITTRTAALADLHLKPYPGSDLALALGLIHVIFREKLEDRGYIEQHTIGVESLRARAAGYTPERVEQLTGISRDDIVNLARDYATIRPAVIRINYGIQRSERGGRAVRAIALLPALTGSWKEVGGGFVLTTSGAFALNKAGLELPELQQKALGREARLVNMSRLDHALNEMSDPPVKALVVYNSNPAAVHPNLGPVHRGLTRPDLLTVVLEQFQTDTADFADFVLPATTFLEHTDIYFAYGHYHIQMARPALPAPGECKPNAEIFRLLAARMGLDEPALQATDDELIDALLDTPHPFISGITRQRLEREHSIRLNVAAPGQPFLPFAQGGFGTPSGKCDLNADVLEYVAPVESRLGDAALRSRFPLEMVSSKSDNGMNSSLGYRDDVDRETSFLQLHPADAQTRKIMDGDSLRIWNDRGEVRLTAQVTGGVRPGVVRAPMVRWLKRSPDRSTANVLTSGRLTDIGGGPAFYNCLVEVEKCEN